MSVPVRVVTLLVAFAAVVVGAVFIVAHYVVGSPPTVDYTSAASGGQVNVVLQEDPQNNSSSKPDWVSYYVHEARCQPDAGELVGAHDPAQGASEHPGEHDHLGYDGCTPPRNNFWTQVQGTMGGTVTVQQFKNPGKPLGPVVTTPTINGWAHCAVGHTFAIPSMHVFVPVGSPTRVGEPVRFLAVCVRSLHAGEVQLPHDERR